MNNPFRYYCFKDTRRFPFARLFHKKPRNTMPLIVPGINNIKDDRNEWVNKLVGKKITDSATDAVSFAKKDLPNSHRILKPGDMKTADYRPERLNIHLDDNDQVRDVNYG